MSAQDKIEQNIRAHSSDGYTAWHMVAKAHERTIRDLSHELFKAQQASAGNVRDLIKSMQPTAVDIGWILSALATKANETSNVPGRVVELLDAAIDLCEYGVPADPHADSAADFRRQERKESRGDAL